MKIKYEDLKCEFCDGCGEFSHDNSDGVAVEGDCLYCNGTGIDQDRLYIVSQPEPEESQTDLWAEIWVSTRTRSMDEMIEHWKNNFTIQRKKQ